MLSPSTKFSLLNWMAWRNLAAKRSRQGLSFMTKISIVGVAVGVAALVIVLSVMGGFEQDLKEKMLKGAPHLEVMNKESPLAGFSLVDHPLSKFEELIQNADSVAPFTQADVVLKQRKHMYPAVLFGVEPSRTQPWGYSSAMVEGDLADIQNIHKPLVTMDDQDIEWPGIVLGDKLAKELNAGVGDEISILSPNATYNGSSTLSGGTIIRHYVVVGLFHTGLFNYDGKWAVVNLAEGRKFMQDYDPSLDADEYVSGVAINVPKPFEVDRYKGKVEASAGLSANSWKDNNASLILALKLEKFTMGAILMLIVLVSAFSISGTMMMTVYHKRRQVSLMRSLGMTERDVVRLFVLQGFAISTVGIAFGLGVGLGVCFILSLLGQLKYFSPYEFVLNLPWQDEWMFQFFEWLYGVAAMLRFFPVKFLPVEYGVICLLAWFLGALGASYPAWTASRQNPSSGLRF